VVIGFAYRTWIRNPDWASTNTVWLSLARDHPEAYRTHWVNAAFLAQMGRVQEAQVAFEVAHRIYSDDAQFLVEYAAFLLTLQRNEEAAALLERSWKLQPHVPRTVTMLAYAYLLVGRYADALPRIVDAEGFGAAATTAMPARAYAYHGLGDHDRAIGAWRTAVNHATGSPWVQRAFYARALAIAGYVEQALLALRDAEQESDSIGGLVTMRVRDAIQRGCYSELRGEGTSGFDPFAMPSCDPLGDYFRFTGQTQIAVFLQNANNVSDPAMPAEPVDSR
jgi:Tfp pilus assembly protein PilF